MKRVFITTALVTTLFAVAGQAQTGVNSAPSPAAAATDSDMAEVVVTAQKRTERAQDVPIALTVISADQLAQQQITGLTDLARAAPSLEFSAPGSAPGGGGIVRGIGTVVFSESAEPSVGVVVDGVTQFNANVSNLFDIAQVEILEGPQGTLFGQSVSAGVINISTVKPDPNKASLHFATQLSADGAGSGYEREIFQTAINVPLTENAALRVAAHEDHLAGVLDNAYLGKNDDSNDYGVRARLLWVPTDTLQVDLIGDYNRAPSTENSALTYRVVSAPMAAALKDTCNVAASDSNFNTCGSVPTYSRTTTYGFSVQATQDIGSETLTSITAYRKRQMASQTDVDGFPSEIVSLPLGITSGPSTRDSDYVTEELRLQSDGKNRLDYVVGAFFSNYTSDYDNPLTITLNFGGPPIISADKQIEHTRLNSVAGFGQATFHVTDDLRFIGGGRVTRATVSDKLTDTTQTPSFGSGRDEVTNISWKAGAEYDVARNVMAYATISSGFKGPQINDSTLSNIAIVKPELPRNYELGVKSTILDGRIGANAGLFYEVVKDFQAQVCPPGSIHLCASSNVSEVKSKGVELSAFGKLTHDLTINAAYLYNPTEYPSGYLASDGTDLSGEQLAFTSKNKLTLSGTYERSLWAGAQGFLSLDAVYRSAMQLYTTAAPEAHYQGFWTLGGELGVHLDNGVKVSIFGRNLTNQAVPAIIAPSPFNGLLGTSYQQYFTAASKRLVGLSGSVDF